MYAWYELILRITSIVLIWCATHGTCLGRINRRGNNGRVDCCATAWVATDVGDLIKGGEIGHDWLGLDCTLYDTRCYLCFQREFDLHDAPYIQRNTLLLPLCGGCQGLKYLGTTSPHQLGVQRCMCWWRGWKR